MRLACIVGARITILTCQALDSRSAGSLGAGVSNRAAVTIVAGVGVGAVRTSRGRVACIARARIVVVACYALPIALPLSAHVPLGARIRVITWQVIGGEDTSRVAARVIGAWISVVARHRGPCDACARLARIAKCAGIAV